MKNIKVLVISISILLISFFVVNTVNAQTTTLSVGVSPTSEKITLNPGDEYPGEIVFWNLSSTTTTYKVSVSGFKQAENMPGTAIILTEEEDSKALYSASSWITLEKEEIELVPNKNIKVKYTIKVPQDATEGEYNAEVYLLSKEDDTDKQGTYTSTVLGSGVPILIKIGEEYIESAELLSFITDKKIYEYPDVIFSTTIKNLGNTHITPIGEIAITNIFGQEVDRIQFNGSSQSLLRENSGIYEDEWYNKALLSEENEIMFGPMTASLVSTYRTISPGFAPLTAEVTFWIIPWKIIIGILVAIVLLVLILRKKKK
jgi:hypothetical protein